VRRVLFIGDGKHDVGAPEWPTDEPFPERVAAIDRENSVAMNWAHPRLVRFVVGRAGKTKGYPAKLRAAQLQIERGMLAVDGIVGVVDEDNDPGRRDLPEVGRGLATEQCPIVCGVAVRSIEAWTIGATKALAEVLGVGVDDLRRACPSVHVEELYDSSGKPELRSKTLLQKLAGLGKTSDSLQLREDVAQRTDPTGLCEACPSGFAPFAERLRTTFGAVKSS
jgi:hypothetical protein